MIVAELRDGPLEPGDVVQAIDGRPVDDWAAGRVVADRAAGETITYAVLRPAPGLGQERSVDVQLGRYPLADAVVSRRRVPRRRAEPARRWRACCSGAGRARAAQRSSAGRELAADGRASPRARSGLGVVDLAGGRGVWPMLGGELLASVGLGCCLVAAVCLTGVPERLRVRPWLLPPLVLLPLVGYAAWLLRRPEPQLAGGPARGHRDRPGPLTGRGRAGDRPGPGADPAPGDRAERAARGPPGAAHPAGRGRRVVAARDRPPGSHRRPVAPDLAVGAAARPGSARRSRGRRRRLPARGRRAGRTPRDRARLRHLAGRGALRRPGRRRRPALGHRTAVAAHRRHHRPGRAAPRSPAPASSPAGPLRRPRAAAQGRVRAAPSRRPRLTRRRTRGDADPAGPSASPVLRRDRGRLPRDGIAAVGLGG